MSALLPNSESIVFSRPLAMGSFMLTSWLHDSTFSLKLGNLILHLILALVASHAIRLAMNRDPSIKDLPTTVSAIVVAFWLLHPLHVSTVLYGVQRMAILSALFAMLAVVVYLTARRQLDAGRIRAANANLFIAFPLLCFIGLLSKQNALVAPLLCLAIESPTLFRTKLPRSLRWFFSLFVIAPGIVALALLFTAHDVILSGYNALEFTVYERLLTQPRVLFDYIGMWFFPRTPQMGLYTDAFPVSTSLLTPPTTAISIIGLIAVTLALIKYRHRMPSALVGWLFFLFGHSIESTFLPLEMYYEHRNYLPSFGLMLIAVSITNACIRNIGPKTLSPILGQALLVSALLVLSFSTLGRVLVWQSEYSMTEQGIKHRPESMRARLDRFSLLFQAKDYDGSLEFLTEMSMEPDPRMQLISRMDKVGVQCVAGVQPNIADLRAAAELAQPRLTVYEVHVAHFMDGVTRNDLCGPVFAFFVADSLSRIVDAAIDQSDSASNKTTIRRVSSQIFARAGRWDLALHEAKVGWNGQKTLPLGSMLARAYIHNDQIEAAEAIISEMSEIARPFDHSWQGEISGLKEAIRSRQAAASAVPK